ncbi:hypothetical protein ACNS7O_03480 [Haloferacaceae archaeon DSL9]
MRANVRNRRDERSHGVAFDGAVQRDGGDSEGPSRLPGYAPRSERIAEDSSGDTARADRSKRASSGARSLGRQRDPLGVAPTRDRREDDGGPTGTSDRVESADHHPSFDSAESSVTAGRS